MIKAFAPRIFGGCSWVLLSIALVAGFPLVARSQPKPNAPSNPAEKSAKAAGNADDQPAAAAEDATPKVETFRDPRAEKMLANTYPVLGKSASRQDLSAVKAMAAGGIADKPTIERYVQHCIAALTSHTNIRALIDPAAGINMNASAHFAIQAATDDLVEPILTARGLNNANFLATYNRVLLQQLPSLLENHFITRIEAMMVLSQTGSPEAVDVFVKQLENRNQTVWVALWAARGLTNVAQLNGFNIDATNAMKAAKAVSDFLESEKNLPWPVKYRALEALGALRQASTPRPEKGQPEMAATAAKFLTDPDAKLEVRAEAGWALGMLQVPAGMAQYNYKLIAYHLGDIAATLGEKVHDVYPSNASQAESWAALLMSQIYQAFEGVANARDSGLLKATHPNARQVQPFIKQVFDRTKPVAAASVKLVRGPGGQSPQNLQDLESKVKELRAWLDKNQPTDAWLVPGGESLPLKAAAVADAQAGGSRVVAKPAGRSQ